MGILATESAWDGYTEVFASVAEQVRYREVLADVVELAGGNPDSHEHLASYRHRIHAAADALRELLINPGKLVGLEQEAIRRHEEMAASVGEMAVSPPVLEVFQGWQADGPVYDPDKFSIVGLYEHTKDVNGGLGVTVALPPHTFQGKHGGRFNHA